VASHDRLQVLESFGRGPALLSGTLRQLPRRMWLFKPSPDRWSVHEIILHLADCEASSYVCCRYLIAEPGQHLGTFDAARWARALGYFHQSTREALEVTRRLRKMTHSLLTTIPASVWLNTMEHPQGGEVSLEQWIRRQEAHIPKHTADMVQNYEVWLRSNPPRKSVLRDTAAAEPLSVSMGTC
jgi:hypothetical protein